MESSDDVTSTKVVEASEERRRLWKSAIKVPIYSVGISPVLVSAVAAWVDTGAYNLLKTLALCLAAIAIIAWTNLSNDVFDSSTGVDKTKPESVVNLMGSKYLVLAIAIACLLFGTGTLYYITATVVRIRSH